MRALVLALGTMAVTFGGAFGLADEPESGLKKTDKGYEHEASGTSLTLPEGWQLLLPKNKDGKELPPEVVGQVAFLKFRKVVKAAKATEADQIYDLQVSWSPLGEGVNANDVKDIEAKLLKEIFGEFKLGPDGKPLPLGPDGKPLPGAKNVEDPVADKPGGRGGWLIILHDGPTRDGKEAGLVYVFNTGAGKNQWKIKIRATYPLRLEKEGQALLKEFAKNLMFK